MRRLTEFPPDAIIIILQNVNVADILCMRFTCKLFTTLPMLALVKTTPEEEWKSQRYKYEQSILAFRRYELDYYRADKTLDLLICNKCGQLERARSVVGFPDSASTLLPQVIKTRECIACRVNRFKNLRVAATCETMIGGEMMFICWLCKEGQPYSEDAFKWFLALSPNKIAKYLVAGAAIIKHKFCKDCWRNRKLIGKESVVIEKPETTDYTELIRMMEKMYPKLGKLGATKAEMDKITQEEELAAELEMLTIAGEQKRKFEREEAKRLEEEMRMKQEEMLREHEERGQALPGQGVYTSSGKLASGPRTFSADGLDDSLSFSSIDEIEVEHFTNSSSSKVPAHMRRDGIGMDDPRITDRMSAPVAALLSEAQATMLDKPQDTATTSIENDAPFTSERFPDLQERIANPSARQNVPDAVDEPHPFNLNYADLKDDLDADANDHNVHESQSDSENEAASEGDQEYRNHKPDLVTRSNMNTSYKKLTINSKPCSQQAKVETDSDNPPSHDAAADNDDDASIAESSSDSLVSSDFSTDYSDVEVDDYDLEIVDDLQPTTEHNPALNYSNVKSADVNMNGASNTAYTDHGDDDNADDEFEGADMDIDDVEAVLLQPKTLQSMDNMLLRPGARRM